MNRALVPSEVRRQRLEAWVAEYSDAVLRTCYIYLADMAAAEDALQETFLKVWRSMDSFEGRNGSSVKTWIIRIAINTCKNYRSSAWFRRVDKSKIIEELPPSVTGVTDESRNVFFEVMQLPDKLKQVVLLYYYDAQMYPAKVCFNGAMFTYVHNLQGDVVGILDSEGSLVVEYKYDAWGKLISTSGGMSDTLGKRNPFRYRGYTYDNESELCYLKERYYVNAARYFTGYANKKVSCTVISDSADVIDMRGKTMHDLFFVDKPGINGTSGGPFYYKHIFNPNEFLVAGMACTTDHSTTTGFAKMDNALSKYDFTPNF